MEVSRTYLKLAGVNGIDELQRLSLVQMRESQRKLFDTRFGYASFRPVLDGVVINELPMHAIAAGQTAHVPILLGTNLDEIRLWSALYDLPIAQKPQALLERQLTHIVGDRAREAIDVYRRAHANDGDATMHLIGDLLVRMPSIRVAESTSRRQPTYLYLFTYRSTSPYKKFDSAHGMEIPFVFGTIDDLDVMVFTGRDAHRDAVMKQVQRAWVSFARRGNPSQPSLAWPQYDEKNRSTMQLGITCQILNDPDSAERTVWNGLSFDGVTPDALNTWALVWQNGNP
jgi:para-nitrobenzyl esterase